MKINCPEYQATTVFIDGACLREFSIALNLTTDVFSDK